MTAAPESRLQLGLLALVALATILAHGLRVHADPDLWWHVRTGELILSEGQIPRQDSFSFTAPGATWTNHEWLSDAVFAAAFRAAGGSGLAALRLALVAACCGLFAWLLWRRARLPVAVTLLLAAYLPFFWRLLNVRPHAFTYLLTLGVLAVFELGARRPGWLYALPALLALWANLHGGFVLGLATVAIGLLAHGFDLEHPPRGAASRWTTSRTVILAACLLAPLATPYGWRLAPYLWRELGADHGTVSEWRPLAELPALWPVYLGLVLPPLLALATAPRRARLTETLLFLASVVLAYRHLRFLALVAIFGSLVLATAIGGWWRARSDARPADQPPPWFAAAPALAILATILALWGGGRFAADWRRKGLELEVDPRLAPVLATRFLADHELGPNLATRLDWGGYALYHLWPRYRVSIDGRNVTVYPQVFVADQVAAYDRGEPLAGLRAWHVDAALVESVGPGFEGMARDPGWTLVFRDPLAAVFVPRQRAEALLSAGPRGGPYEFTGSVATFP